MKRFAIVCFLLSLLAPVAHAQILDPELGPRVTKKENTKQRDAISLTHVREADLVWSTRIWQTIDMRQKMNQPLYFPLQSIALDSATHGKRSFVQVIFDEFVNNEDNTGADRVQFFKTWELRYEIDRLEALNMFQRSDSVKLLDRDLCQYRDTIVNNPFADVKPNVTKVLLMEDWFFDKQRSVMDVRILALGLAVPAYRTGEEMDMGCSMMTFTAYEKEDFNNEVWFFFPQLRERLAEIEVYKRFNDAARLSYDDIFLKRMFTSYITKEENVFDRSINEYTKGLDALLEAERIKGEIFDFEQNLWEY